MGETISYDFHHPAHWDAEILCNSIVHHKFRPWKDEKFANLEKLNPGMWCGAACGAEWRISSAADWRLERRLQ